VIRVPLGGSSAYTVSNRVKRERQNGIGKHAKRREVSHVATCSKPGLSVQFRSSGGDSTTLAYLPEPANIMCNPAFELGRPDHDRRSNIRSFSPKEGRVRRNAATARGTFNQFMEAIIGLGLLVPRYLMAHGCRF